MSLETVRPSPGYEDILPIEYRDLVKHGQYGRDVKVSEIGKFKELVEEHPMCAGCAMTLFIRLTMMALPNPEHTINVGTAGCGRLAISQDHKGKGLGGALLLDALQRSLHVDMGVYAMLVEAKDSAAQTFYEHHGFIVLPSESQHRRLMLPMATARKLLER